MALMSLCPVCLGPIQDSFQGAGPTVAVHYDTIGKLCPMSGQPMPDWGETNTRQVVAGRSGGICEWCGTERAREKHHRKSRGVGGKWHPANIIDLCSRCHSWATHNPKLANEVGLVLKEWEDPEAIPVTTANGMTVRLTDLVTTRGRWADF